MSSPKILVFGSTGSIGFEVAAALAKKNVPFRAAVHNVDKADKVKNLGKNIEVVQVDLYKPETVAKALQGIEKVFFMTPPGQTSAGNAVVDAMHKADTVKHIVKLSALGAEEKGGKFVWAEQHRALEEYIIKYGIPITSLRPSSFHTNILADIPTIKSESTIYKALGNAKMNWISNKDIGEVAAKILTENGNHAGKIYNLTGPDTLSSEEMAKIMGTVIGKNIKYASITNDQLRQQVGSFLPPQAIDGFCNMYTYFADGGYNREFPELEKLLGRKGISLKEYVEENKQAFA